MQERMAKMASLATLLFPKKKDPNSGLCLTLLFFHSYEGGSGFAPKIIR
jgi:hypothetical protein